jgi:hypothetical protein
MPEWLKGADCKSASESLRWFESISTHHFQSQRLREPKGSLFCWVAKTSSGSFPAVSNRAFLACNSLYAPGNTKIRLAAGAGSECSVAAGRLLLSTATSLPAPGLLPLGALNRDANKLPRIKLTLGGEKFPSGPTATPSTGLTGNWMASSWFPFTGKWDGVSSGDRRLNPKQKGWSASSSCLRSPPKGTSNP